MVLPLNVVSCLPTLVCLFHMCSSFPRHKTRAEVDDASLAPSICKCKCGWQACAFRTPLSLARLPRHPDRVANITSSRLPKRAVIQPFDTTPGATPIHPYQRFVDIAQPAENI